VRLVIDLQGAQTANRRRGIGRYSLALAQAMARQSGAHDIWIALNRAFPDTIESIRAAFDTLVPQERIVVWDAVTPVTELDPANSWRMRAGEILRESFLASLKPDIIHVSSLFEGAAEDAITSVGTFLDGQETAVTLYDLIPLIRRELYLDNPAAASWYWGKIGDLRRSGMWLAISESSRREGIEHLSLPPHKVINISTAADRRFRRVGLGDDAARRYGLTRPFVMYTGGIDHRKNIDNLISAYAKLPLALRVRHQLAIICDARQESVSSLKQHAQALGLGPDELVMTGYVTDDDLLALYNSCKAFCFPSWHEGFGLPALEAMQCGAAVIASNTSSIPEVVGRADALFDPFDDRDMATRLYQVLTDEAYRQTLTEHGVKQARRFTWEESARRAWVAFESHHDETKERKQPRSLAASNCRPRLAYLSPLPPEPTGIADYSAELLPELARHYDIDVVVSQPDVGDAWIKSNCPIRDATWFDQNASSYDRILYHFGNSHFHEHMFHLANRHPGVVALHDFYLGGILDHMTRGGRAGYFARALYQSHGYHAVRECHHVDDFPGAIWNYPANLPALQNAMGVIVHSNYSRSLAQRFYGDHLLDRWHVLPFPRHVPQGGGRHAARRALGYDEEDFIICSFGMTGATKLNHRCLQGWFKSELAGDPRCHLVFVGHEQAGTYEIDLRRAIDASRSRKRVRITGFAAAELYRQYLRAADVAVQLRALSRGETSAAVIDCMGHALPTIVNAHGALSELPQDCVFMLRDEFDDAELAAALETLHADARRREALGGRARAFVVEHLSPRSVADQYFETIEYSWRHSAESQKIRVVTRLAAVEPANNDELDWVALARMVNGNTPSLRPQRQLLVDISELVQKDVRSGIQRVTRAVLMELLATPPEGYRVEPVYATGDKPGYSYAREFTLRFLGCPKEFEDSPIEVSPGDVFLGLDLQPHIVPCQADALAEMRRRGVTISFVVYDLLPVQFPQFFGGQVADLHGRWLSILGEYADGVICISRAVAEEFRAWLAANGTPRRRPLSIDWFHLGSDIESSLPTRGLPDRAEEILDAIAVRPSFLMVGTIEPRKGHEQTLAAVETLWSASEELNLVIVGQRGWNVDGLIDKLRGHPELGKRLFWLEGISDEFLEQVYAASACLIAASEGEGFGLPLIEAARHKLPILARDIPVFGEVAGEHASYFSGKAPEELARAIKDWLALFAVGRHPRSDAMPWLTWEQSSERLKQILLGAEFASGGASRVAVEEADEASLDRSPPETDMQNGQCQTWPGMGRPTPSFP
jgi:glycosyltransferase involved in cell wall biosynthesis